MRIHLGHHFYGAGNLGDDFMLAGFLSAMRTLAPGASYTASVPFPLEPLRSRFPEIQWLPYETKTREDCIAACDAWLGLGGSPFQSAQSRWFIDHLIGDAAACARHRRPMFYLGVGVQTETELNVPDVRAVVGQAAGIWTRDAESAARLSASAGNRATAAADISHVYFRETKFPGSRPGTITVVPNFDYAGWPGVRAFLAAAELLRPSARVWLAQESRELPGAERALHAALADVDRARWTLVSPEIPGLPLAEVTARWPSTEWLVTSRFHSALAGAWTGSKVVVIATNEKLRAVARALRAPTLAPDASEEQVIAALRQAPAQTPPMTEAMAAFNACRDCMEAVKREAKG